MLFIHGRIGFKNNKHFLLIKVFTFMQCSMNTISSLCLCFNCHHEIVWERTNYSFLFKLVSMTPQHGHSMASADVAAVYLEIMSCDRDILFSDSVWAQPIIISLKGNSLAKDSKRHFLQSMQLTNAVDILMLNKNQIHFFYMNSMQLTNAVDMLMQNKN